MSGHSDCTSVGWPVNSEYALTFMRNPSGLRSAHPCAWLAVMGR